METQLQSFNNPKFGTVRVAGTSEEPLFCLADVCKAVGLKNPSSVKVRLDEPDLHMSEVGVQTGLKSDGTPAMQMVKMIFVNESGFYDVLLQSDAPQVKPFRKWVTSEVLPSIRKHGAFMTTEVLEKTLLSPDYLIRLATTLKEEKQKRIEAEHTIKAQAPKVLFADAVASSDSSILIGQLAKMINQNGCPMGQMRLFRWMRDNGYLMKYGSSYNLPTQKAMDMGLFDIKETAITHSAGNVTVTRTTKVTGKGQVYFLNKFLKKIA